MCICEILYPKLLIHLDSPAEDIGIKVVSELSWSQISYFIKQLDINGENGWRKVCSELRHEGKRVFDENDRLHFERSMSGGGNPSLKFWRDVIDRHPEVSVQILMDLAEKHGKHKLVTSLSTFSNEEDIEGETEISTEALVKQLSELTPNDWRNFADDFGFTSQEVDHIDYSINERGQYSATQVMIQRLCQKCPTMTLQDLQLNFENMEMNHISNVIESWLTSIHRG